MRQLRSIILTLGAFASITSSALAGAHTWRIAEIFTNADGSVQFVELFCVSGSGENFVGGLQVTTGTNTFTFPGNLAGSTLNKRLLLGTTAFAALPGAPAPNYTIPANFFAVGGGFTIRYNPPGNYDSNVVAVGAIPTNGTDSLTWTTFNGGNTPDTSGSAPMSPTNFAGCTVEVCDDGLDNDCDSLTDCDDPACATAVPACVPTVSEWGVLVLALLTMSAGSVMLRQRT